MLNVYGNKQGLLYRRFVWGLLQGLFIRGVKGLISGGLVEGEVGGVWTGQV
jgi:hypothetical protein